MERSPGEGSRQAGGAKPAALIALGQGVKHPFTCQCCCLVPRQLQDTQSQNKPSLTFCGRFSSWARLLQAPASSRLAAKRGCLHLTSFHPKAQQSVTLTVSSLPVMLEVLRVQMWKKCFYLRLGKTVFRPFILGEELAPMTHTSP